MAAVAAARFCKPGLRHGEKSTLQWPQARLLGDQTVIRGDGGETHQFAGGQVPVLTAQQGIPVADD